MKAFFLLLLLAAPVSAQSIHPTLYGQRYCQLRALGVDDAAARKAAVAHSYDRNRSAALSQQDISAATSYVFSHCPSAVD
jgi:hypothetical protein